MPLSTRHLMREQVARLDARGLAFVAGIEVECHVLKAEGPPPEDGGVGGLRLLNRGYQYLTELRYDELDPLLEMLRGNLEALGLPLRSLEVEFGPSQIELTFGPDIGLAAADTMMLVRSCVKQSCRRAGYFASFMCRPKLPQRGVERVAPAPVVALAGGWAECVCRR